MSRQFWKETLTWAVASGTAVANSATETILFPNVTIPANYLQDGRALHLMAYGAWGTFSSACTFTYTLRWGGVAGTVIAKSAALVASASMGGGASMTAPWSLDAYIQTRSNGSSGTLMTNGRIFHDSGSAPTQGTVTNYSVGFPLVSGTTGGSTPVVATVDLTSDTALSLTITLLTNANAANSIQGLQYYIESQN